MSRLARALAATGALALAAGSAGCGASKPGRASDLSASVRGTTKVERAALQLSDLPAGFRRCGYSGDLESFISRIRDVNPTYADSTAARWDRLRSAGATEAFAAFYGDSERACRRLVLPAAPGDFDTEAEHAANHPRMASSIVVEFASPVAAEAAFAADALGQSELEDHVAVQLSRGKPTRLGANSLVMVTQGTAVLVREAAWQREGFTVLFRSAGMDRSESETSTAAINLRMR